MLSGCMAEGADAGRGSVSVVLHDAANSPCGRRVRLVLLEKGLPFEIRWLNLGLMDQKRPEYLALNPSGLVPTLVHDGRVIFESNVIAEYLDDCYPEPRLVPADAWERTRMRMWLAFELEWAKPFRDAIYETYGKQRLQQSGVTSERLPLLIGERTPQPAYARFAQRVLEAPPDRQLVADRIAVLFERLAWMERELEDGRPWLLGEHYSFADIALAPRLAMFPFIGVDDLPARFPRIGSFLERMTSRPAWAASDLRPGPELAPTAVGRLATAR